MTQQHPRLEPILSATNPESVAAQTTRRLAALRTRADEADAAGDHSTLLRLREAILRMAPDCRGSAFDAGYEQQQAGERAEDSGDLSAASKHRRLAEARYQRELALEPNCAVTYNNLGNLRATAARLVATSNPDEALRLWMDALSHYAHSLLLHRRYAPAAYNAGRTYFALATVHAETGLQTARRYWKRAGMAFSRTLGLDPSHADAASEAGGALAAEASAIAESAPEQALALWRAALERHELAWQLAPEDHFAAIDCGNALLSIARATFATDRIAARRHWNEARRYYRRALQINPGSDFAEHNIGNAFFDEAEALAKDRPASAQRLFAQAEAHYAASLVLAPLAHDTARRRAESVAARAKLLADKNLPEARQLWREATRHLLHSLKLAPTDPWTTVALARTGIAEAEALAATDPQAALHLRTCASQRYRSLLRQSLPSSGVIACHEYAQRICEAAEAEVNPESTACRRLWRRGADAFIETARRHPRHVWAWNDAAYALLELAETWRDPLSAEPTALRLEAIQCCKQALRIAPKHHTAHTQWGNALWMEADAHCRSGNATETAKVRTLWRGAILHHQQSLALRPDKAFSHLNLALLYADQSDSFAQSDRSAYGEARASAQTHHAEGLKVPGEDVARAWEQQALIELRFAIADATAAGGSASANQRSVQRVARQVLKRIGSRAAVRAGIRPPALTYAQAAAKAVLGDVEACVHNLEVAAAMGRLRLPLQMHRDPSFDSVRETEAFQKWWSRIYGRRM